MPRETDQIGVAFKALMMRQQAKEKARHGRRFVYVDDGVVVHAFRGRSYSSPLKRRIMLERGKYTGERLREIRAQNGSGKGLRELAIRQAKKMKRTGELPLAA